MEAQAGISGDINSALIGTQQYVLVEGKGDLTGYPQVGRCRRQAPEIDGVTHIRGETTKPGELVACSITGADDYDLFAEII
jgi:ribosomal protein S12 methylthiotransferase